MVFLPIEVTTVIVIRNGFKINFPFKKLIYNELSFYINRYFVTMNFCPFEEFYFRFSCNQLLNCAIIVLFSIFL